MLLLLRLLRIIFNSWLLPSLLLITRRTFMTADLYPDQSYVPPCSLPGRAVLGGPSSRRAAGHCGGGNAGARGTRGGGAALVGPLVDVASARVHEEVADGGELQTQLVGDGDLQLFGGAVVLPEDGQERAPLQVREHQPGALRALVAFQFALLLLLPLAGCRANKKKKKERGNRLANGAAT